MAVFMQFLSALALLAATLTPALAGETPWQEVAPGVKLRLISSGQIKPDGQTLLGLEISMPETTKTYWRVPGETGLPTVLDFTGSTGVDDGQIVWPYPRRDEKDGYLDYVYYGSLVLPVAVTVSGDAPKAEIFATMGVCSEICVPAQARFSLPLTDAVPDAPNGLRIRQALALAPVPWDGATPPLGAVHYLADEQMLAVELTDSGLDPSSLIVATASGEPLFGAPQKSPEPHLVLIPILDKEAPIGLESQDVQLTFMTDMGAFEVTRTVAGSGD